MTIKGTKGDDTLTGTAHNDIFVLSQGGNDIAKGQAGNDTFQFGAAFTAHDQINGGAGNDTLSLVGNYANGNAVTFGAKTMVSVETIKLGAHHDYSLTTNDANVAKNQTLTVNASKLGAADSLTFNGSRETDGHFAIAGGKGNDVLTGGAKSDSFTLIRGGIDNAHGGAGNDTFTLNAALTAADKINGGAGSDTLNLNGDYFDARAVTFGAKTMLGVEKIVLANGHDYELTTSNATVAAGATLTVDGSALSPSHELDFDGSHETNGHFHLIGGGCNDTLIGGAQSDVFDLTHGGFDTADGNGGDDTFHMGVYNAGDAIDGGAGNDTLTIDGNGGASVDFSAGTITSVESVVFGDASSYDVTVGPGVVSSGETLTLDGRALTSGHDFTVDGSAVTDGAFSIYAGAGNNTLTGGAGNDTFSFGGQFHSGDAVDGGGGYNILSLDGDYSGLTITSSMLQNVENIELTAGHTYNFSIGNGVAAADGIGIFGQDVTGAITVDASAETTNGFSFAGGSGDDTFTGGGGGDYFEGLAGADTFIGNGGNDGFAFSNAAVFAATTMDGGSGSDTISLFGQSSFANTSLGNATSIEDLQLSETGHNFGLTTADTTVDSGATLTIHGEQLTSNLTVDGSAETDGGFDVKGGSGDDTLTIGSASVMAASTFDGGAGSNTLVLNGSDFTGDDTLSTVSHVNTIQVMDGHNYYFGLDNGDFAAGTTLTVDASALTGSNQLTLDAQAVTHDFLNITGGAGDDTFSFWSGPVFAAGQINGGAGNDTVQLGGIDDMTITFSSNTIQSVEQIELNNNLNYNLTMNNGNVASGATLNVSGANAASVTFDGSAETNGQFHFIDSAGDDTLAGGDKGDTFTLSHGGADTIAYTFAAQSTSVNYDTITGFDASSDHIALLGAVTSVNSTSHAVTTANFDSDIAAACGGDALGTHGGLLITDTDTGSLNGHVFLVIDVDGNAAYNAGTDYVIDVTGHSGTFTTGTFTVTPL